jgi:hypothetical protein
MIGGRWWRSMARLVFLKNKAREKDPRHFLNPADLERWQLPYHSASPARLRACSETAQLPETPSIRLPTATPAFHAEQNTFGAASHFGWAESLFLLGRPAKEGASSLFCLSQGISQSCTATRWWAGQRRPVLLLGGCRPGGGDPGRRRWRGSWRPGGGDPERHRTVLLFGFGGRGSAGRRCYSIWSRGGGHLSSWRRTRTRTWEVRADAATLFGGGDRSYWRRTMWDARFASGKDRVGTRQPSETFSLTRRWHTLCKYKLLRVLVFRESPEEVLRILYINFTQLLGSSFPELECSALLHGGFSGNWKLVGYRTRPYLASRIWVLSVCASRGAGQLAVGWVA